MIRGLLLAAIWIWSVGVGGFSLVTFVPSKSKSRLVQGVKHGDQNQDTSSHTSTTRTFLNKIGFRRLSRDHREIRQFSSRRSRPSKIRYNVTTLTELESYFDDVEKRFRSDQGEIDYDALLKYLRVVGDTQMIGSKDHPGYTHPVVKLLHERRRTNSRPTRQHKRDDGCRVALAIEGGGMRGCVSAGMACAIHYLNLTSSIDVVYGSSAGSIVGAFLLTGQVPWYGPEVYYDRLTSAGSKFIDTRRILRALGFGLLDPRLLKDVLTRPYGKPVLNLSFLLKGAVQGTNRLDWEKFKEIQEVQPLKVVASQMKRQGPLVMDMQNGYFDSLEELAECMHASCLLPGLAGPVVNLDRNAIKEKSSGGLFVAEKKKLIHGNNMVGDHLEPLADGLLYEPVPYRSALEEGATHVVVIRSRPDGVDVTGKGSIAEKLIFRRFFLRKNRLPNMYRRVKQQLHKKIYAEDMIRLNDDAFNQREYNDTSQPHLMAMATPPGSPEVTKLETGRRVIYEGIRRGFARAYDCLVEDPAERGRGAIIAKEVFPEEVMDYDPLEIVPPDLHESAFEVYMREQGIKPAQPLDHAAEKEVSEPSIPML